MVYGHPWSKILSNPFKLYCKPLITTSSLLSYKTQKKLLLRGGDGGQKKRKKFVIIIDYSLSTFRNQGE